jgi:hypothetical protein
MIQPQGHSPTGRTMSMKKFNYNIGNRTRDLAVCIAVPQPTAPLRSRKCLCTESILFLRLCLLNLLPSLGSHELYTRWILPPFQIHIQSRYRSGMTRPGMKVLRVVILLVLLWRSKTLPVERRTLWTRCLSPA